MKQLAAFIAGLVAVVVADVVRLWPRCQTITFPDALTERDCRSYPAVAALVSVVALVVGAIVLRVVSRPDT